MYRFMFTTALILSTVMCAAKNWDPNDLNTEQGRIRSEYLGKAGLLPEYGKDGQPTGGVIPVNCCGEADAYEADDFEIDKEGNLWAILTCNDPEDCKEIPYKIVRLPGTKVKVSPKVVLKNYEPVNNTGHGWVYIHPTASNSDSNGPLVLCWAAPAGL